MPPSGPSPYLIVGDWGTTRLRLSLSTAEGVVDSRSGPGVGALTDSPAHTVQALVNDWLDAHGTMPIILCGMAGSRNGWKETPYLSCPANATALSGALSRFEADRLHACIVPGLSCTNRLGAPDVMRGEETQIIGALTLRPEFASGRQLFCLPGTHTKWVSVQNGRIIDFLTAMTGEVFALLRDQSMISKAGGTPGTGPGDGFVRGVEVRAAFGGAGLVHGLFGARSRQLVEGASQDWALAFVSGLLVGSDVDGAVGLFDAPREVVVIGDPALIDLYEPVLRRHQISVIPLDGSACSLAGVRALAAKETAGAVST